MKKLRIATLCLLGAFALAGCAASESADATAKTLKDNGYSATVYDAQQYKTLSIASSFTEPAGLTNHLVASKTGGEKNLVLATWFFASIDQASTWQEANQARLSVFFSKEQETSIGQRNNVVWAGSIATADLLGWRSI